MSKGLKQMVEEAIEQEAQPAPIQPVQVSDEALRAYAYMVRQWSGWHNATLEWGDPSKWGSPFASCHHSTRTFTANPDRLVLNPNRVLLTVTPFRMRQEAVLTGALLHEAGHARHSHWKPRTSEAVATFRHGDGTEVTPQEFALASLLEEPRIEGLMARDADNIGAAGLDWTLRASAAHLVPTTGLSVTPDQRVMDVLSSWVLRAGRQIGLTIHTQHHSRPWVGEFTNLLHDVISSHLLDAQDNGADINPTVDTKDILDLLFGMIGCTDDTGPTMVDKARDVLRLLFPETEGDTEQAPMPGAGCAGSEEGEPEQSEAGEQGEQGQSDEAGEQGEGNTEPEDEGSGEDPGAGDAGQDGEDDGATSSTDEPEQAEQDSVDDSATPSPEQGEQPEQPEQEVDAQSELAKALAELEAASKTDTQDEAANEAKAQPKAQPKAPGGTAGSDAGEGTDGHHGWRAPSKDEREVQKGAERFLRSMIEPSERARVVITDQPSSTVDGAALAAWKAGGQIREPNFFRRTKREIEPSPPVKIAILVDVSGSMEELQHPSALLSWALSSAAMDLRNFAGRGQQIESCLIHWGNDARVIQHNGEPVPGIREFPCYEGTYAMAEALELVEAEMPGFYDLTERPVNRLLVQFTDWELAYSSRKDTARVLGKALASGVNMVTVAPHNYAPRHSALQEVLSAIPVQRGKNTLLKYNSLYPERVWDQTAEMLDGKTPAPFAGF